MGAYGVLLARLGICRFGVLISLVACALYSSATAASFDCTRARAPDERAICGDRVLNDQDVRLSVIYDTILHFLGMGARDAVRERQAQWLEERRHCGADRVCLREAYAQRLRELQTILDKAYALGPL